MSCFLIEWNSCTEFYGLNKRKLQLVPHRPKKASEPDHEQSYHQFLEFSFKRFKAIGLHIICQPSPLQNLQSCQEHNTKINNSAKIKILQWKLKIAWMLPLNMKKHPIQLMFIWLPDLRTRSQKQTLNNTGVWPQPKKKKKSLEELGQRKKTTT